MGMSEIWELVWGKPEVDPSALAQAIEKELASTTPDHRTCVLIRDSTLALERHWGANRLQEWISHSPVREKIMAIQHQDLGETGFPLLKDKLMERTEPDVIKQFLRELGTRLSSPARFVIGGSIALILTGKVSRATADIDLVDEVPESVRTQHSLVSELQNRYNLLLTHFQSHFLPNGWQHRLEHFGTFGVLDVYTVNPYDIFLGKLFSSRSKDLDDLRAMKPLMDKKALTEQLLTTTTSLLGEAALREAATKNWYILFGEELP